MNPFSEKSFSINMLATLTLIAISPFAYAQLGMEEVAAGLTQPLFVTAPPGDQNRIFIVEQQGRIRISEGGTLLGTPFLDITGIVNSSANEEGLLGLAFHPDYANNGFFYLNYTNNNSGNVTRIARYTVNGDPVTSNVADPASELILLEFAQPESNHNGGMLAFGPNDGFLYIATGDGGGGNDQHGAEGNGQSLDTLLGKMLRIDVDAAAPYIPLDNPDLGGEPEIWAYGLRNPWRFSFDAQTGDMYIGDVGQNNIEEVSFQPADSVGGENYGWRVFEGTLCNTNATGVDQADCDALENDIVFPIYEYGRADGFTVIGGYVYRGNDIPSLRGTYVFADLRGDLRSFRFDGVNLTAFQDLNSQLDPGDDLLTAITSFGEDGRGELYIVVRGGFIYKITGPEIVNEITASITPGFIEAGTMLELQAPQGGSDYQWWKFNDGTEAFEAVPEDAPRVTGVTDRVLTFDPVLEEDAGTYKCTYDDGIKAPTETPSFDLEVLPAGSIPVLNWAGLALAFITLLTIGILVQRRLSQEHSTRFLMRPKL